MKKSGVKKTSNGSIDAQSIARHFMVIETKGSYVFPRELENLKEPITAYDALNSRIIITKNGTIRCYERLSILS